MKAKTTYLEAVGRRKTAIARVRLFKEEGDFIINDKPLKEYFPTFVMRETVKMPLVKTGLQKEFRATIKLKGGGINAQAEAVRLGISRALLKFNPELRPVLKAEKFLKRDPRAKERRKFGLKKARKAPQWSKR